MSRLIKIFDTTLRDGEQSPGCTMNTKEKIQLAKQLEKLGVDVIEAGFPAASQDDFKAVSIIAENVENSVVAGLSRALKSDIDKTWQAIRIAKKPRIHIFLATSNIHMEYKLKMTPTEVLKKTYEMVKYAKSLCADIEFSAEDASRTEIDFLQQVIETAIEAGATVVNIPDTVGYTTPTEYADIIKNLKKSVKNIDKAKISVHCHNDLGLGVSNSLSAVLAGADQIECTINGIGERAGNAALEEIVMAIKTRKDFFNMHTNINTKEIVNTSKLLSAITGVHVQQNKAIVGANAFAHEAGIHQHGVLSNKKTYEIMTPESIGLMTNSLVLGKHSGKHAFENRLINMGFSLSKDEINQAFGKFKDLADKKKKIFDKDIEALARKEFMKIDDIFSLEEFSINIGSNITSSAIIKLKKNGDSYEEVALGDGPIDASYNAILKIVNLDITLLDYSINSITEGRDALGEAVVKLQYDSNNYIGTGLNTDVIAASIEAYINAINKILQ